MALRWRAISLAALARGIARGAPFSAGFYDGGGGPVAATYRYFRLHITAPATAGQSPALAEWELYESEGGPNVATLATATASSDGFGWVPGNINNGDTNGGEGWHAANNTLPQWVQLDFGAGNEKEAQRFVVFARGGREDQALGAAEFQGSNDGTTWTTLHSVSGLTAASWQGTGSPARLTFTV